MFLKFIFLALFSINYAGVTNDEPERKNIRSLNTFAKAGIYFSDIQKLKIQGGLSVVYSAYMTDLYLTPSGPFKVILKVSTESFEVGERECDILKKASNFKRTDIVKVHSCHPDSKFKSMTIVMEYIDGSDMFDWCRKHKTILISAAKPILKSIASAVLFIHSNGIFHRDIKLENIMMRYPDTDFPDPVLIDFGHASTNINGTSLAGSYFNTAPEYFNKKEISEEVQYEPADVYALGILFMIFLSTDTVGIPHDPTDSDLQNYWQHVGSIVGKSELLMERVSDYTTEDGVNAQDLISGMIAQNPENRLNMKQVVDHPFFE